MKSNYLTRHTPVEDRLNHYILNNDSKSLRRYATHISYRTLYWWITNRPFLGIILWNTKHTGA